MSGARSSLHRAEAGFTLIELLIALTLLGLLSVALFGGLRFGARSWESVSEGSAAREEVALAQAFIRSRLGEVSIPGSTGAGRAASARRVRGGPARVDFMAPWLSRLSLGDLYRFSLASDGAGRLIVRWEPVNAAVADQPGGGDLAGERVLLDGIEALRFSYFGAQAEGAAPVWSGSWESEERMPRLIRLDIAFADGRRIWPPLIVARQPG